jgi:tetratricopeptide (TPR) repeat protein
VVTWLAALLATQLAAAGPAPPQPPAPATEPASAPPSVRVEVAALAPAPAAAPAPSPATPPRPAEAAEALRFGDWLAAQGDLYRAIGEYQRVRFLAPGGALADAAGLAMARAYAEGGKPDAAVTALRRVAVEASDAVTRDAALYLQASVRYRAGQAGAALAPLQAYLKLEPPAGGPGRTAGLGLLVLAKLRDGDASGARLALEALPAGEAEKAADLRLALDEVAGAPHRSPVVAGLLSVVLPGLGHAYAGDPAAGAGALALNGLFVWATVEAFRDRRPGLGALLLVGESLWYGGAIFGAVAEAMRFNRDGRAAALDRAERRLRWVVVPLDGGVAAGASVRLD